MSAELGIGVLAIAISVHMRVALGILQDTYMTAANHMPGQVDVRNVAHQDHTVRLSTARHSSCIALLAAMSGVASSQSSCALSRRCIVAVVLPMPVSSVALTHFRFCS